MPALRTVAMLALAAVLGSVVTAVTFLWVTSSMRSDVASNSSGGGGGGGSGNAHDRIRAADSSHLFGSPAVAGATAAADDAAGLGLIEDARGDVWNGTETMLGEQAGGNREPITSLLQQLAAVRRPPASTTLSREEVARLAASPDAQFDIVYTWVNGSEPVHVANRAQFGGPSTANDRDRDNGELRFSLRSIEAHMPWWNGTLYFVHTNLPCWLEVSHPRLKLVRHEDIFLWPDQTLPTFNSDVIEAFLHRIPGLSRTFVYMNDDVYIGRMAVPSDFFQDGRPLLWLESFALDVPGFTAFHQLKKDVKTQHAAKLYRTKGILQDRYRSRTQQSVHFHALRHVPIALTRDRFERMWQTFATEFQASVQHRFRRPDDIATLFMHHHYCLLTSPKDCVVEKQARVRAETKYFQVGNLGDGHLMELVELLLFNPPLFFCTNDVQSGSEQVPAQIREELVWAFDILLPLLYPARSSWESADATLCDVNHHVAAYVAGMA